MPVLDGFMAANQIKQGGGPNVDTPIVALTANSMPGDRERCLDAGMQHYISKPVRQQQVVKAIVDWASANSSGVDMPDEQANVVKLSAPDIDLDSSSVVTQADGHQDGESKQIGEPAIKPSETASNAEIINSEAIDKIRELQRPGKADLLSKVLTLYFDKTPEQIDLLLQAVTDEDFEQAKSIVHGMKSSSAYLGAEDLASTCGELESSIRDGKTDNVATLADLILEQYCAAEAELKQFVKAA